jgi:hypothetical protein
MPPVADEPRIDANVTSWRRPNCGLGGRSSCSRLTWFGSTSTGRSTRSRSAASATSTYLPVGSSSSTRPMPTNRSTVLSRRKTLASPGATCAESRPRSGRSCTKNANGLPIRTSIGCAYGSYPASSTSIVYAPPSTSNGLPDRPRPATPLSFESVTVAPGGEVWTSTCPRSFCSTRMRLSNSRLSAAAVGGSSRT